MRTRLLTVLALLLSSAGAAWAQRVLHVNAEMVREGRTTGIHDAGYQQIGNWMRGVGANVTWHGPGDLARQPSKTKLTLAVSNPDLVTISATLTKSRTTVTWLVKNLKAQGMPGNRIVLGGLAMSAKRAAKLGVRYAPGPGLTLQGLLAAATPRRAPRR
jgi:methanogenic corrinoid protein MtbC1